MEKTATRLVDKLIMDSYLHPEDRDMYIYVFQKKVEQIIGMIALIILSVALHVLLETTAFYISFSMIRERAGGFHCNTSLGCLCTSVGVYAIFVLWLYPIWTSHPWMMYGMLIVAMIVLLAIGAVNHPNMAWNMEEYLESKKKTRINTLLWGSIILILCMIRGPINYIAFLSFSVVLPAIFVVIAKMIRMEVRKYEEGN